MTKYIVVGIFIIALLFIVFNGKRVTPLPGSTLGVIVKDTMPTPTIITATTAAEIKQYPKYPDMVINPDKNYEVTLETTKGTIKLTLFPKEVPKTVNNFVFLTKEGFYDGTKFHRIIQGFMIQGGDPKGNGTGSPGYQFADESVTREYERGIIAMANAGPNTNGSQFFIMHQNNPLPKNYTIFGEVNSGIEVVDKIAAIGVTGFPGGEQSTPTEEVKIIKATVLEK